MELFQVAVMLSVQMIPEINAVNWGTVSLCICAARLHSASWRIHTRLLFTALCRHGPYVCREAAS